MATTTRLTADRFLRMGENPPNRHAELIDGEVFVEEAGFWHQKVAGRLYATLLAWADAEPGRGTVTLSLDVRLDEHNSFVPDVMWFAPGRTLVEPRPQAVPDVAVEIRSPTTGQRDLGRKKTAFERHGLPELWLVDHAAVLVYRRSSPGAPVFDVELELMPSDTLTSPLLRGFALDLERLFA